MKLIFEKSVPGRHSSLLPPCDVPAFELPESRQEPLELPELCENDVSRTTPSSASGSTASTAASTPWAPAP